MATECTNCGSKLQSFDKSTELLSGNIRLCKECAMAVKKLLDPMNEVAYKENLLNSEKALCGYLQKLYLTAFVQKTGLCDVNDKNPSSDIHIGHKFKSFKSYFAEGIDVITDVIETVTNKTYLKGTVTGTDHVKTVSFIGFLPNHDSKFADNIHVTLLYSDCTCNVIVFSNDADRLSAEAASTRFWNIFKECYPEIKVHDFIKDSFIGVFGGTFDPIHNGHIALAKAALKECNLKKLILMPAEVQPFKIGREISADYHRIAMARAAFKGCNQIEVSEYEVNNDCVSYTYDTLVYLKQLYPDSELFFILGTDSFLILESWKKGAELLQNFSFIVSMRPGYREDELDETIEYFNTKYGAHIIRLIGEMPEVSSTEIKERIKKGLPVSNLIPKTVEVYINEHGLYK